MAVVKGINCGFVTEAPQADPAGSTATVDNNARAQKDVAPAEATVVTEIGWWCRDATDDAEFTVGIYEHNIGDDEPEALVGYAVAQKGTTAGWKRITGLSIPITPENTYWVAVQLDDTVSDTRIDWSSGADRKAYKLSQTTLTDPWGESTGFYTSLDATYAVYQTGIKGLAGVVAIESTVTGAIKLTQKLIGVVAIESTVTGDLSKTSKYENFLADYTEVDPTSDITRTSTKVQWTDIPHTATTARVYCNKGANYFSGAYKHQFEIRYISASPNVITLFWGVLDEGTYADALYYDVTGGLKLQRENGGMETDNWAGFQKDTTYYITVTRTAGGTLTAEIRTGSHTGNLEDTLQVTGATGDCNLIFGYMNLGDTDAYATGFTQNLDLDVEAIVLLAGVVAIESTVIGELDSPIRELAGTVAISSTVIGELVSPVKELAGVVEIESTVTGQIKTTRKLAGIAAIESITSGALKATRKLAGVVTISSTVVGQIKAIRSFAGVVTISSTVVGELSKTLIKNLAGVVTISSTVVGQIKAIRSLAGVVTISSTVVGQIKAIRSFAGVITISSTVVGQIKAIRSLAGVVTISSVVTGELIRIGTKELAGIVAISSTVIGNISMPEEKMLAGIVVISSAVTGELVVRYPEIPSAMLEDLIDPYGDMGAWLWLAEIVVPTQATQRIARNTADVVYGVTPFVKSNFDIGRISLAGDASIPRIQLRVAQDPDHTLEDIVNATKGGEKGTVKLIRTCEKYFDSPVNALERTYDILTAGSDPMWVTFTLGIPNPLTQRIPLWSYSSKVCPLATPSLFKGPRCQYPGEDTVCTGLFSDCRTKGNEVHWGAEIGLDPNAVRV